MKKIIVGLALMLTASISYAKPYVCTGYYNGSAAADAITVNASKAPVAESKAKMRLEKAGLKIDYVQCD